MIDARPFGCSPAQPIYGGAEIFPVSSIYGA